MCGARKGRIWANPPKKRELVVHSGEWTTSFPEKGRNQAKVTKCRELVVHFLEWTTSSRHFGAIARFSAISREASGPLSRVDH